MNVIFRSFWLVGAAISLFLAFAKAAFYLRKSAYHILEIPNPALMMPHFQKRFEHYFFGTTYLALLFCSLHGRRRHASELKRFALLSALTCYFDDLTENTSPPPDQLGTPELYGRAADPAGLALHFLQRLYREFPPIQLEGVKKRLNKVFALETNPVGTSSLSIRQELGASSVLLFRQLLDWPISAKEEKAWASFGAFIQLCDDIFDVWHDQNKGILTPVLEMARSNDMEGLIHLFDHQYKQLKDNLAFMPPSWRKHLLLAQIHWLSGMTRFCLLRYKELLAAHGHLPIHNRKEMVTDMGLWRNRWGAVWVTLGTK